MPASTGMHKQNNELSLIIMNTVKYRCRWTLAMIAAMTLATSCLQPDYLTYDKEYAGLYFANDTLRYSFSVTPTEVRSKEYLIPVEMVGCLSDKDRALPYIIVADSTTATEGVQYSMGNAIVGADSIRGYIPVTIYRDALEGNYHDGYVRYRLELRLIEEGGFTPTMSPKQQVCVLFFDNAVDQPNWFDYRGDKVWSVSTFGIWHPLKLIKMVEYFHAFAEIQPETYRKMVELYGDNLEHVPFGDFYQYRTIMNKYVFDPMYKYFANPDNRDEIVALYPDFPFDFPDPYRQQDGI